MPVKDAQGNTIQENLKQNFAEEEKPVSGETKQKN